MVDFIGKVKNKAGDVEKILKEKDRHGKKFISFYGTLCSLKLFSYNLSASKIKFLTCFNEINHNFNN